MSDKTLFLDRPLHNKNQDTLGYYRLAEEIVASVELLEEEGIVVGIEGPWGSGKSTLLNYVELAVHDEAIKKKPAVVRFNPWWFSGREDLYTQFFKQLASDLRIPNPRAMINKVAEGLDKLGGTLSKAAKYVPVPVVKEVMEGLADAAALVGHLKEKEPGLDQARNEIINALNKYKKPIWVFIDDLDRLEASEILQMFALVRSLADFPWISYFLAYDQTQITKHITDRGYTDGNAYLEKVFDLPFSIPPPSHIHLYALFERCAQKAYDDQITQEPKPSLATSLKDNWSHPRDWYSLLHPLLTTPRRIKRLFQSVTVRKKLIGDEHYPRDLVLLEALRLYTPAVYAELPLHKALLVGGEEFGVDVIITEQIQPEVNKKKRQELVNNFQRMAATNGSSAIAEATSRILTTLFPKLDQRESEARTQLRVGRRVADPETFWRYFQLQADQIRRNEVISFLELVSDQPELLSKWLVQQMSRVKGCNLAC